MKKIIFLILVITTTSNKMFGQDIFPLYSDNPTWNICTMSKYTTGIGPLQINNINYSYEKDTTINSLTYSKIKNTDGLIFTTFIRNENKKVYISINDSTEFTMYDFSLNLYDTIDCPFSYFNTTGYIGNWRYDLKEIEYYVTEIDSILIDNTYRKVIKLQTDYPQGVPPELLYNMTWVEGLGSIENPLYPTFDFHDFYWTFDHLLINGDTIYKKEYLSGTISICDMVEGLENVNEKSSITIYPNPFIGKFIINSNRNIESIEIYGVLGEKIFTTTNFKRQVSNEIDLSNFPKGIYFAKIYAGQTILTKNIVMQ